MRYLLCLLFVMSSVWAQPVEGPYHIAMLDFDILFKSVAVGTRCDYVDLFFTIPFDPTIYAAEFCAETRTVTRYPYNVLSLTAATRLEVHDPIALDADHWALLVYEGNETGENTTYFIIGDHESYSMTTIDSGYVDTPTPADGDNWNVTFSLTPRIGGGAVAGWIEGVYRGGTAEFVPRACVLSGTGEIDGVIGFDYHSSLSPETNRAVFRSISHNVLVGSWRMAEMTEAVLWGNNPDGINNYYITIDNDFESVMNFGRTSSHDLLGTFRTSTTPTELAAASYVIDEFGFLHCDIQYEITMPGNPTVSCWHPEYGFAVLSKSDGELGLARIDTALNEVQPPGELNMYHDYISNHDAAISDGGKVFILWEDVGSNSTDLKLVSIGWHVPLDSKEPLQAEFPESFTLSAYPNPFNSTVKLSYELPVSGDVSLSIYNLTGQKVATIVDDRVAAGTYEVSWTPEVASGVYFAQLNALALTKTAKLLYLK